MADLNDSLAAAGQALSNFASGPVASSMASIESAVTAASIPSLAPSPARRCRERIRFPN
jgi:hypothetical protein